MTRRLLTIATILLIVGLVVIFMATPYVRAASLVVRAANLGGRAEAYADEYARPVTVEPTHMVPTRYGNVAAKFYMPDGETSRAVLLVPGIHSMGIEEPRLTALAKDLAGTGVIVMTMALPDLQAYMITPRATDVIEDAVSWMAQRPNLAPDGRVGIVGISFAGGLSIVAAGRPAIRDQVAFILSFGGHGDLPRVMRYLATGAGAAGPGPGDASASRLRRVGDSLRPGRPRRRAVRSGRRIARRHRDISAGLAAHAGQHGSGERDVHQGARDGRRCCRSRRARS